MKIRENHKNCMKNYTLNSSKTLFISEFTHFFELKNRFFIINLY